MADTHEQNRSLIGPPEYGVPDDENPELTAEDIAQALPFAEVFPEIAAAARNKGGRPKVERPKVKVGWRLSADVVEAVTATGKGYNARVDAILRRAIAEGRL